ncbi:hypothetical protein T492DRAFT_886963 [Pavlovales sp. CCMP2436]|nr:hypothetical protein T492DRAFT_886963 [Pavlovales sp. CCMP2436]
MNGNLTSPFCVSLKRLNNEICQFPLKLDELGKPTVDFSNVVWIVRLIQVRNGWSRRIALRALLSSQTLERTREQDKLIMDALSAGVSVSPVTPPPPKLGERARHDGRGGERVEEAEEEQGNAAAHRRRAVVNSGALQ